MANVTKTNGRLLYIEPNDLVALDGVHSFNGSAVTDSNHHVDGHFWNPEDLNMSVDLQVIMPNREDCGQHSFNEIFTVEITNDNSTALGRYISFMQGSDIEGKTYNGEVTTISNDLTTSYLNASYQEMYRDKKSDKESLGIESVDITFDSHFYPQVNIKFIDVRGYSLMMPTDMAYIGDQKARKNISDNVAGQFATGYNNFFRALFRFPYPRFLLTIKGYYGNSITFILAVNEFKNNFNSETGNFEVTVSFIGYMYGLYTDIPLNFLICAPYYGMNLETGKEKGVFWSDDFRFDDGHGGSSQEPMCTFIEYIKKCDDLNKEKEKYKRGESENEDFNEAIKWRNEVEALELILETLFKFTKSIFMSNENRDIKIITEKEDGNIISLLCLGKTKDVEVVYDREYWNSFVDKYLEYEENADSKLNALFPDDFYKDGKPIKIEADKNKFKIDCDGFYTKNGEEYIVNSGRTCENGSPITLDQLRDQNPQIYKALENEEKRDWFTVRQNFADVYEKISKRISDLNTQISAKSTENVQYMDDACEKALGFVPTINNYFRMIFAHLDCFMSGFYDMLGRIKESKRKLSDLGFNRELTDLNKNSTDECFVPPFTAFFREEDNRRVEIYPGSIPEGKNLLEVKYVESLLNGALSAKNNAKSYIMESVNDKTYNDDINNSGADGFSMVSVTDIAFEGTNPYTYFKKSPNDPDMFGELLYFFTCRYLQSKFQCGDSVTEIGISEANNYIALHKNVPSKEFKDHLKTAKDTSSKIFEELNNFYANHGNGSLATIISVSGDTVSAEKNNIAVYSSSDKKDGAVYYKDKNTSSKLSNMYGSDRSSDIEKWRAMAVRGGTSIKDRIIVEPSEYRDDVIPGINDGTFDDNRGLHTFAISSLVFNIYFGEKYGNNALEKSLSSLLVYFIKCFCPGKASSTASGASGTAKWYLFFNGEDVDGGFSRSGLFAIYKASLMFFGALLKGYYDNPISYYNDNNEPQYLRGYKKYNNKENGLLIEFKDGTTTCEIYVQPSVLKKFENNEYIKNLAIRYFDEFAKSNEWKILYTKINECIHLSPGGNDREEDERKQNEMRKMVADYIFAKNSKYGSYVYFYEVLDENENDPITLNKDEYVAFVNALYNAYNGQKSIEEANNDVVDESDITEAYKLEAYNALKNLYDKWINSYSVDDFKLRSPELDYSAKKSRYVNNQSYYGLNNGHGGIKEYDNFVFIDAFYNDISSRFKINPDSVYKLIVDQLDNKSNYSVYEFMADICQKNRLLFLALPVLNNFYSKDGLENIFRPQIENTMKRGFGSTYVCMYTYEVSHVLEDESQTSMCDDGITDLNDIASNAAPTTIANLFNKSQSGMPLTIPAFGVTYARQNQQYFKNINVNMDNPRVTDYSIANLFELANWKNDGTLEKPYTIANDVYSIYANRSYNCSVEMLGCANIMPLMYFQLNNIPMFRGAYIITNVEHHIRAGNFSTLFTGVRVSRNQLAFNEDVFNIRKTIGLSSSMDGGLEMYDYDGSDVSCENFNVQNAINRMHLEMVVNTSKCHQKTIVPYNRTYAEYGNAVSCGYCVSAVKEFVKAGGEKLESWGDGYRGGEGSNPPISKSGFVYFDSIPAGYTRQQMKDWCISKCQPGDIAFMHHGSSNTEAGHACMYDGTYWVSDFRQDSVYVYFSAERDGRNSLPIKIFRHKDCHKYEYSGGIGGLRLSDKKLYFNRANVIDTIKTWWCSWEGGLDLTKPYTYDSKRWGVSSYCGIQGFNFRPAKTKPDVIDEQTYMEALNRVFNSVSSDVQRINDPALKLVGYFCCLWGGGATKHFKNKYGSMSAFANLCNSNSEEQNIALLEEVKTMLITQYNAGNIVPRNHWNSPQKFEESKVGIKRRISSITHEYAQLNS